MSRILIIDDRKNEREELLEKVSGLVRASVVEFKGDNELRQESSYESHLSKEFDRITNGLEDGRIALIACDKELGAYKKLRGLSATPVSAVALDKGLPFCVYSRQAKEDVREFARFRRLRQWDSEEITLEGLNPSEWAPQVASLFKGFESIRDSYNALGKNRGTPPRALATILGKPEVETRIALYAAGEQAILKEVLTFYDPAAPDLDDLFRRMPRILGTWLLLSVLRFPGILVNEIAAASYLNINVDSFRLPNVQTEFSNASYGGPFKEMGPWWWRHSLDEILDSGSSEDGRAFLASRNIDVEECVDPTNGERAGYYCMLTSKPVSRQNSRDDISWFPSGADLARIREDKFDEITALIGV